MSGHIVGMSGHIVGMSGHIVGLSGHIVGMSGHIVGMSGHIVGMSGHIHCVQRLLSITKAPTFKQKILHTDRNHFSKNFIPINFQSKF